MTDIRQDIIKISFYQETFNMVIKYTNYHNAGENVTIFIRRGQMKSYKAIETMIIIENISQLQIRIPPYQFDSMHLTIFKVSVYI